MPPEVNQVDYSKPLDVFSFGHLSLFVLVQVRYDPLPLPSHTLESYTSALGWTTLLQSKVYMWELYMLS